MSNANLLNGSGVALGDYNGDGWCDIYLCDLSGRNALFQNTGNWKFVEVTEKAGVACPGQTSTGAVFADINGDRRLDLLVTSMGGPNACFLNLGNDRFTNITAAAGLVSNLGSTSMALADMDGNGTLDLYVANYGVTSLLRSGGALAFRMVNGRPVVTGRHAKRIKIIEGVMYELGEPDVLYRNDGKGVFEPVSWTGGSFLDADGKPLKEAPWDQGLAVLFRDLNGDGHPDLYLSNDASTPDRFWLNDGQGNFRAIDPLCQRQTSYYSMCADAGDFDRDGRDDLFVVDMLSRDHLRIMTQMSDMHPQPRRPGEISDQPQVRRNTLFLGREDGTFAEVAQFSGVAGSEWSWGGLFLDVDLDGWEDLLVANGFAYDMDDLDMRDHFRAMGQLSVSESRRKVLMYPPLHTPNLAFRNERDLTFRQMGSEWGFNASQISNGMAFGDLDNDGDLDVVINCFNSAALLYRNDSPAPRLAVRLKGDGANTQGIGARITVTGGPVAQSQEMICGGRYMSGDDAMRVFAAGSATALGVEIGWRSGKRSVLTGAAPGYIYEIAEASAQPKAPPQPAPGQQTMFEDVSDLLSHTHHEELFDDAARQPLLPRRLSQGGPGIAWFDWDRDGDDDLIIGTGKGGHLAFYRNEGNGSFAVAFENNQKGPAPDDFGGIVGFSTETGASLLAALQNYESGGPSPVLHYQISNENLGEAGLLEPASSSSGPLAMADINGDGRLDLFVGGRVIAGRYPAAASSRIYLKVGNEFKMDSERTASLSEIGLVNGAVFSDIDGDGRSDLLLACEWGPLRLFLSKNNKLVEATEGWGLNRFMGWWNGVATGDFDGDGRMDIAASNWGRNTRYQKYRAQPLRLYYGDLDGNTVLDIVEAHFEPSLGKTAPLHPLEIMNRGFPGLRERIKTHKAYAQLSVEELFGAALDSAKVLQANWLESTVFLNRGDHFEPRALPIEAQFAPVFGIAVGDFDGNGAEDLFLAQNFFATMHDASRYDAGRGLLLRGDGKGGFQPVPGQESGIKVYGEQRGCALADYNNDGRLDLVVTQNGAKTKLFRNINAKSGLRVRLQGRGENPLAIGAAVRLFFGEKAGPIREVQAGSGYWSQNSAAPVLALPEPPTRVWVRWPGGKETVHEPGQALKELIIEEPE